RWPESAFGCAPEGHLTSPFRHLTDERRLTVAERGQWHGEYHVATGKAEPPIEPARELLAPPVQTRKDRIGLGFAGAALAVLAALVGVVAMSTTPTSSLAGQTVTSTDSETAAQAGPGWQQSDPAVAPVPVSDGELAALPQATTFGTVPDAPHDDVAAIPS